MNWIKLSEQLLDSVLFNTREDHESLKLQPKKKKKKTHTHSHTKQTMLLFLVPPNIPTFKLFF